MWMGVGRWEGEVRKRVDGGTRCDCSTHYLVLSQHFSLLCQEKWVGGTVPVPTECLQFGGKNTVITKHDKMRCDHVPMSLPPGPPPPWLPR